MYVHILSATSGVLTPTLTEFTLPFIQILLFPTLLLSSVVRNDDFFNNFLACLADNYI